MREKDINQINQYLKCCVELSLNFALKVRTKHDIRVLQNSLKECAKDFGTCINLRLPLEQDFLTAYVELKKAVIHLNNISREYNGEKDILTFPLPYVMMHYANVYNITMFTVPELDHLLISSVNIEENHTNNSEDHIACIINYTNFHSEHHYVLAGENFPNGFIM